MCRSVWIKIQYWLLLKMWLTLISGWQLLKITSSCNKTISSLSYKNLWSILKPLHPALYLSNLLEEIKCLAEPSQTWSSRISIKVWPVLTEVRLEQRAKRSLDFRKHLLLNRSFNKQNKGINNYYSSPML